MNVRVRADSSWTTSTWGVTVPVNCQRNSDVWRLFFGAFVQVLLVATNTVQIAKGAYATAFITGTLLSLVWTINTHRTAKVESWSGRLAYALGAGCGTVTGLWLGRML